MENELSVSYQREYKDRLFKFIFGQESDDSKKWRLQLYNALNGTNYNDPDALKINTIENVIYMTMHNDISFLVDSQMTLFEQQSSWNPNMPLRGLFYFSQLYQIYLTQNDENVISSQLVKIPTPKFVVFYNGTKDDPDSWKLKLSTAFEHPDESGDFEWTATVINMNPEHNKRLHKNCKPLYHYNSFVYRIKSNIDNGMSRDEAIEKAVDFAIKENFLDGFFKTQRAEIIGMILTEFDEEQAHRIWRKDGYIDGRNEGKKEKAEEVASNMIAMNLGTSEQIAQASGLPLEKVIKLQESKQVSAK
jgi:hypothetical protein